MAVKAIPAGYHSVTPYLMLRDGAAAIEFYKKAFGAKELMRFPGPQGKLVHAEVQIGDSPVMLADEMPEALCQGPKTRGGTTVGIMIYVENADAVFNQAVAAGAKVLRPLKDQFYGDRSGSVEDPFGHVWTIATHKEDVSSAEMAKRAAAEMQKKPGN
jgi:PhnB protein